MENGSTENNGLDLQIITMILSILSLAVTSGIAWVIHRWTKRAEESAASREVRAIWQSVNAHVITDIDIQDFEINNLLDTQLNRQEIKKVFYYFMQINAGYTAWYAAHKGIITDNHLKEVVDNTASILYKDREFVQTYCLRRGYEAAFVGEIKNKWEELYKKYGDVNSDLQIKDQDTNGN